MKKEPKEYTLSDIVEARDEERNRIRIIIEYLLNKNSRPIAQGSMDFQQAVRDIEDLEHSLYD